jgi:hypothetical protein
VTLSFPRGCVQGAQFTPTVTAHADAWDYHGAWDSTETGGVVLD